MDVLDGRRAVVGDVVECISDDWEMHIGSSKIEKGFRYTVTVIYEPFSIIEAIDGKSYELTCKHLGFKIHPTQTTIAVAICFRIVPPDTKAEKKIEITTTEDVKS